MRLYRIPFQWHHDQMEPNGSSWAPAAIKLLHWPACVRTSKWTPNQTFVILRQSVCSAETWGKKQATSFYFTHRISAPSPLPISKLWGEEFSCVGRWGRGERDYVQARKSCTRLKLKEAEPTGAFLSKMIQCSFNIYIYIYIYCWFIHCLPRFEILFKRSEGNFSVTIIVYSRYNIPFMPQLIINYYRGNDICALIQLQLLSTNYDTQGYHISTYFP